jgi:hypothetical protein
MSDFPVIRTAIPLHRYQAGDYQATLLGEIESGDRSDYRFILAFIEQGQNEPSFYVCCERNRPPDPPGGAWRMRLVNSAMSEVLDAADEWRNADAFAADALEVAGQALGFAPESVQRLT